MEQVEPEWAGGEAGDGAAGGDYFGAAAARLDVKQAARCSSNYAQFARRTGL
jgi:hypothetical protein